MENHATTWEGPCPATSFEETSQIFEGGISQWGVWFHRDTRTQEQDLTEADMCTELSFLQEPEVVTDMRIRRKINLENSDDAVEVVDEHGKKKEEEEYFFTFVNEAAKKQKHY